MNQPWLMTSSTKSSGEEWWTSKMRVGGT
jgi:hypothetical protein